MKYYIPEYNLGKLKKLVNRLSKKTKVEFSYDENDVKQEKLVLNDEVYPYMTIGVNLDIDYKVGDYEVVAELEHQENGNIIRQINHNYKVPTQYRTCKPHCEHCNKLRRRANTFLLVDNNNNFKQVGKSCLNDYTGYDTLKLVELVSSLNFLLGANEYDEDFIEFVKLCKWDSLKEMANRFYQLLLAKGYNKENTFDGLDDFHYNEELDEKIEEILNVVNTDWYNDDSNYCYNVKVVLGMEYIEYKHWKLLISYINSAMTYLMNKNVKNEYIGKIGDRIEFTIKSIKVLFRTENYHSYYSDDYIFTYRILTNDGYVIIWKTNKDLEIDMTIKATIKEYKEYKGEKQTVITRGTEVVVKKEEKEIKQCKAIEKAQIAVWLDL